MRRSAGPTAPILVMAHGLGGTRGLRLDAYAERFAAAGYHVLLFGYRHFGDSDGEPRQLLGIVRQRSDWRAAVAHARRLPGADPDRVALWGTSLSGGHVLVTAARDRRVAAVVAQVPHVSGVAAAAATRSPDALPGIERMVEQSAIDEPSRQVAARVIPQLGMYAPGRLVRGIAAPTLVQLARRDVVTPHTVARRAAGRMRRGEVKECDLGHFDAYVAPHFETVIGDQLAFLHRVLPAAPVG
jgi:uncharacterized protein